MVGTRTTLVCTALLASVAAWAQDDPEKAELKRQIAELKRQQQETQEKFDKRISEIEKRLEAADKKSQMSLPVKSEILTQARFDYDSGANDSFYVNRVEMKFSGKLNSKVGWTVMIDPAKSLRQDALGNIDQSTNILQDAFVSVSLGGPWNLDFGQKKIPFSLEALQPTGALDTLERALFITQGKIGNVRDVGAFGSYRTPEVEVVGSVTNGSGESQNRKDPNENKAVGGRVVYRPKAAPGLQIGASGVTGNGPDDLRRERLGLDLLYVRDKLKLKGEAATGLTSGKRATGWYAHAGFRFQNDWEAVMRYDRFDPDRTLGGDDVSDWILGLNYFIEGYNSMLQLNWVNRRFGSGSRRTLLQFGMQTKF